MFVVSVDAQIVRVDKDLYTGGRITASTSETSAYQNLKHSGAGIPELEGCVPDSIHFAYYASDSVVVKLQYKTKLTEGATAVTGATVAGDTITTTSTASQSYKLIPKSAHFDHQQIAVTLTGLTGNKLASANSFRLRISLFYTKP